MLRLHSHHRLIFAALLLSFAGSAFSQQTAPQGDWSGLLSSSDTTPKKVRVQASFSTTQVSLHFNDPYACRIDASYNETTSDGSDYAFKLSTNGGSFCNGLYPGELSAMLSGNGVVVSMKNNGVTWSGTLQTTTPKN